MRHLGLCAVRVSGCTCVQIVYNAEQKQLEAEEKLREAKLAGEQESAYQARVKQASAHDPPTYFGRPKVQWFY